MDAALTLVFVCDDPAAHSAFYAHLQDAGLRVLAAQDSRYAATYYFAEHVDGVLIHQDDAQLGPVIGRDMKTLFPNSPVVLVSTGVGMMALSPGLDAVCYASCLDDEMASTMAMLFRNVFTHCPYENNDDLGELSN